MSRSHEVSTPSVKKAKYGAFRSIKPMAWLRGYLKMNRDTLFVMYAAWWNIFYPMHPDSNKKSHSDTPEWLFCLKLSFETPQIIIWSTPLRIKVHLCIKFFDNQNLIILKKQRWKITFKNWSHLLWWAAYGLIWCWHCHALLAVSF